MIARGDDLGGIRSAVREDARTTASAASHPIEREGITSWDFGELPPEITLQGAGHDVIAYPALVDAGDTVSIRLVSSRPEQIETTWDGTRRLLQLQLPNPTKLLRLILNNELRLTLSSSPYAGTDEWMDDCVTCSLDQVMVDAGGLVWNHGDFQRLLLVVRDHLADVLEQVGKQSEAILRELHEVERLLATARGTAVQAAAEDVAGQIGRFIYPGFLAGVGADRLDDLGRYLAAVSYRLRKVPDNLQRDHDRMVRVRILEDELDALMDSLPWSPRMVEVSWMLQELRVSMFAQPIGAKGPVSEKRVRRALQELLAPD